MGNSMKIARVGAKAGVKQSKRRLSGGLEGHEGPREHLRQVVFHARQVHPTHARQRRRAHATHHARHGVVHRLVREPHAVRLQELLEGVLLLDRAAIVLPPHISLQEPR